MADQGDMTELSFEEALARLEAIVQQLERGDVPLDKSITLYAEGDKLRAQIIDLGAKPVIPNKSNRVVLHPFSKRAYKGRNVIERCFCRLKDFRRIATRYDKLARNFLAAVHLAAIVAYWL